jgi:hypothetical protein
MRLVGKRRRLMTSHDWARELQKTAEFLLSKPEVKLSSIPITSFYSYSDKTVFLDLVRALKPGKKKMDQFSINFYPQGTEYLQLSINRDLMCKRLNPEYECTPLLSKEEDAEMEETTNDRD